MARNSILLIIAVLIFSAGTCVRNSAAQVEPAKSPGGRIGHSMVFHDGLQRILLFGGRDEEGIHYSDLWAWDGRNWTLLDEGGQGAPAPRSRYAMAYDPKRNRLVLQGGGIPSEDYGDTWEWDGARWIVFEDSGPGPRSHHAMAYDSVRGAMILFGGGRSEGLFYHDTWSWDGASWTKLGEEGPPGRVLYSMTNNARNGKAYLFGGFGDGGMRLNDLWSWNGGAWAFVDSIGPTPRMTSAIAFVETDSSLVLFGGQASEGELGDTWIHRADSWYQKASDGPSRGQHAMAYDSVRNRLVLFGGSFEGKYLLGVHEWDGTKWILIDGNDPAGK